MITATIRREARIHHQSFPAIGIVLWNRRQYHTPGFFFQDRDSEPQVYENDAIS